MYRVIDDGNGGYAVLDEAHASVVATVKTIGTATFVAYVLNKSVRESLPSHDEMRRQNAEWLREFHGAAPSGCGVSVVGPDGTTTCGGLDGHLCLDCQECAGLSTCPACARREKGETANPNR